jgi:hypothetical protein
MIISVIISSTRQAPGRLSDQKLIDRTFINSWEDRRVVEAARNTGRKK